jgi:membrane-associated phospholipid phosphatase
MSRGDVFFSFTSAADVAVGFALLMRFIDRPVAHYFQVHDGAIFHLASLLTVFGEARWWLASALVVFVVARFMWRNPAWAAGGLFVFASVVVSGLVADIIKFVFGRARPELWFSDGTYGFSYLQFTAAYQSFPSGHTACATAACAALVLILPRYRLVWITTGLATGFSRIIVTAHYVSDVIAAMLLAVLVVVATRDVFARFGLSIGNVLCRESVLVSSTLAAKAVGKKTTSARASHPGGRLPQ